MQYLSRRKAPILLLYCLYERICVIYIDHHVYYDPKSSYPFYYYIVCMTEFVWYTWIIMSIMTQYQVRSYKSRLRMIRHIHKWIWLYVDRKLNLSEIVKFSNKTEKNKYIKIFGHCLCTWEAAFSVLLNMCVRARIYTYACIYACMHACVVICSLF